VQRDFSSSFPVIGWGEFFAPVAGLLWLATMPYAAIANRRLSVVYTLLLQWDVISAQCAYYLSYAFSDRRGRTVLNWGENVVGCYSDHHSRATQKP
jgi:hypothetical protein